MNIADELLKLERLRTSGTINDEEFAIAKAKLLSASPDLPPPRAPHRAAGFGSTDQQQEARMWGMLLHLSNFAGFLVPLAGLVAPIVIWQLKKDELPDIDAHGKNALNWIISEVIYFAICFVLCFVLIGFLLLIALGVVAIVFPIIAAVKANNGEVWRYPMSITFVS